VAGSPISRPSPLVNPTPPCSQATENRRNAQRRTASPRLSCHPAPSTDRVEIGHPHGGAPRRQVRSRAVWLTRSDSTNRTRGNTMAMGPGEMTSAERRGCVLVQDGWPIGVNFRSDEDGAAAAVGQICNAGGVAIPIAADVSCPDAVERAFAALEREFGLVAVLVNNAGTTSDGLVPQLDDARWNRVVET